MTTLTKVLIANRGEIAVRVIRSARAMGYRTVAVYSEADAGSLHTQLADEAICLGAPEVSASYLNPEKVLDAAKVTGADAIHPGYGFLSENTAFSAACAKAGITFIGPDAPAIELMGNKRQAKIAMLAADVPCIPGYEGADQDDATLTEESRRIGFPVMVKAAAGGGGRGMRQVDREQDLLASLKSARSEASNAFGSGELILEKAIIEPRHIEIQVFADRHGNCIYLGERDCSIQRRFQKVVEESPSPFMTPELRQQMGEAAVRAALSCHYVGAGTVEFLVDKNRNFYFLEMNTRLQVEHPVTELVTGIDLVEWQLRVAAGEKLPISQEQVSLSGHAIEVRLYAEDPASHFMPQTGTVLRWQPPAGDGIRVDHGICEGQPVSPFYDPMIAKVIAAGSDRESARRRLVNALENMTLFGVRHNQHFLADILKQPLFIDGGATTAFLDQLYSPATPVLQAGFPQKQDQCMAALLFFLNEQPGYNKQRSWSALRFAPWHYLLASGEERFSLQLSALGNNQFRVTAGQQNKTIVVHSLTDSRLVYLCDGVRQQCDFALVDGQLHLSTPSGNSVWENHSQQPAEDTGQNGDNRVLSSMDGAIIDVLVQQGDRVESGQTVVILEAMKMEHSLKAQASGKVEKVHTIVGSQVKTRQCLVEISVAEEH